MYKYLCVISDNADKKDFYNTVKDVKNCYPDCRDAPEADINCLRRIISVTEENVEKNICIRYDLSDRKVSILSDIYLDNFFKGKEIENVLFYSSTSKTVRIISSIVFTVINITVFIFTMFLDSRYLISSAILVCIYMVSTVIFKKKTSLKYDEIAFIQFGGIAVLIAILLMYIVLAIFNSFIVAVIITAEYFKSVIIPLTLNMIFFGLLRLITNTVKNKKIN